MGLYRTGVVLLGCMVGAVGMADAQSAGLVPTARARLGITGVLTRPVGEFQQFVDWGGGVGLYGVIPLGRRSPVGIRIDGSAVLYGHESVEQSLMGIPRMRFDVTTTNHIVGLGVGPQVTFGHGPLQPYVYGTVGFSYFATTTSLSGSSSSDSFAETTNLDDVTAALAGGAGVLVRLSRGRRAVALDVSLHAVRNGEATYLRKGGVRDGPGDAVTLFPIRSQANLVNARVGISIAL